jgi:three-Cys-motif partner protein
MPTRNLHAEAFDLETCEKLEIYASYLREFLPVFIHSRKSIKAIQIFDFFAGPGKDKNGKYGSPLITRQEVDAALHSIRSGEAPPIRLYFNEFDKWKYEQLAKCFDDEALDGESLTIQISCMDFTEAFEEQYPSMKGNANLVFLDQNGVKQISQAVFQRIVQLPKTDLIFFISSSMANRFKEIPDIRQYLPLADDDYVGMNGSNVHRRVANAYRRWIPFGLNYYLSSFSIRKGANVYGLIFGSGHPRGIDKFLRVSWQHGGDANFDIDADHLDSSAPSLFEEYDKPKKLSEFEARLADKVLTRQITDNKQAYIFALENGCLGSHAKEALHKLVKDGILPAQSFAVSYDAWEKPEVKLIRFEDAVEK